MAYASHLESFINSWDDEDLRRFKRMLKSVELKNFGPITHLKWPDVGSINLVIGGNGSGKTFLLKALYSAIKTMEEYRRGDDRRLASEILADKLFWTFQTEKMGDLVTKGIPDPLSCSLTLNQENFRYCFGKDATKKFQKISEIREPRASNSIFLPAKEVLSIHHIILKSREQDQVFGFDDTYLDLARALSRSTRSGRNYRGFVESRRSLKEIIGGRIEYDDSHARWVFRKGNQKFFIGVTSEGVKKIAILDTLLGNRYLDTESIIFIDEPEAALHPSAVSEFLEIISILAKEGIQFFLASHSYFVLKKLALIAQRDESSNAVPIRIIAEENGDWQSADLKDGLPENKIIDESIKLYEEEVKLALR